MDFTWESEEAQAMDWNSIFYQLFEMGDDFAQSLPQGSTWTIYIVDRNGNQFTVQGENQWYEPPQEYSPWDMNDDDFDYVSLGVISSRWKAKTHYLAKAIMT